MRCMVKMNNLEELVEPPLQGNSGVSTLDLPKDVAMELDEADRLHGDATTDVDFNTGEVNFGLV